MLSETQSVRVQILEAFDRASTTFEPLALHIRGGGSKAWLTPSLGDPTQPQTGVEWLRTDGLRGIVDYAPSELVITAGAGTPLAELEAVLAERGQYLPFEPPHFGEGATTGATLGGMVATGLAGPARAAAGSVRDHVLGLHLINGRGEYLQFGGQVIKNVAGYDVSRLMAGSMGTLGLITQVSLKVLARPVAEATLCLPLPQSEALAHLQRWAAMALPLNASCWVHDDSQADRGVAGQDLLFVRLRGAHAAVESACGVMLDAVRSVSPSAAGAHRMDTAQAAADWALCRDQRLPFFLTAPAQLSAQSPSSVLWRLSLPSATPALEWDYPTLVEWHGALRWVWAPLQAAEHIQQTAWRHGGSACVWGAQPGDRCTDSGLLWGQHSRLAYGAPDSASANTLWEITCRVKQAFDPYGLFNPALSPRSEACTPT